MHRYRIIYLDTNIYLDYLLDRKGETGRELGELASGVFHRIMKCEFYVAVSEWNLQELRNHIKGDETKMFFQLIKKKTIPIKVAPEDWTEAKKLSEENAPDALHVILAKKAKAELIVTRNTKHFYEFSHLIQIKLPEEV